MGKEQRRTLLRVFQLAIIFAVIVRNTDRFICLRIKKLLPIRIELKAIGIGYNHHRAIRTNYKWIEARAIIRRLGAASKNSWRTAVQIPLVIRYPVFALCKACKVKIHIRTAPNSRRHFTVRKAKLSARKPSHDQ